MEPDLGLWQEELNKKLDRLISDVEFIKNRTSVYLGRNEALTYLVDETPIIVNTDDFGGPMLFLNGGRYEEEYFSVLLSFRKPGMSFLDVGANLGVYSLRLAAFLGNGSINAFEPIPRIRNLFSRSVILNGYGRIISIHSHAVSDHDGEAILSIPRDHAGGATLGGPGQQSKDETVTLRKLDDFFPADFVCDMLKLDVEGHELHALRGMKRIMARSPHCIVMFEKLASDSGIEADVFEYAESLGWTLYVINGVSLTAVDLDGFTRNGGYFVAGRPNVVEDGGTQRNFFDLYPADFNIVVGALRDGVLHLKCTEAKGAVLFYGPYWFLPRGNYCVTFDGEVTGEFKLEVCERFGYKVADADLREGQMSMEIPVYRDLCKFEFVLRASDSASSLKMRRMRVARMG
ncbi:MAG: FkbM family methyltransferase [Sterolibacteriaceae bacterium]|nr:FkbM family methyltransferase [Candidatus Methylophosphatis haderslevensis]